MNPEDYVSYPLALALKKAGFDWPCMAFYERTDGKMWVADGEEDWNSGIDYSAPSLWQAQKWLREVKEWIVYSVPEYDKTRHQYLWAVNHRPFKIASDLTDLYTSYESALSAGIAVALELIDGNKCNPSPDSTHSC